jgi:hypothetical protein
VRSAFYAVVTLVLGFALFFGTEYYILEILGQTECDERGECSFLGDLAYGSSANMVLATCLVVAGGVVWVLDRLIRRSRKSTLRE